MEQAVTPPGLWPEMLARSDRVRGLQVIPGMVVVPYRRGSEGMAVAVPNGPIQFLLCLVTAVHPTRAHNSRVWSTFDMTGPCTEVPAGAEVIAVQPISHSGVRSGPCVLVSAATLSLESPGLVGASDPSRYLCVRRYCSGCGAQMLFTPNCENYPRCGGDK